MIRNPVAPLFGTSPTEQFGISATERANPAANPQLTAVIRNLVAPLFGTSPTEQFGASATERATPSARSHPEPG